MVPEVQPERALALFHRAIYNRPWDDSSLEPPIFLSHPANLSVASGGTVSFSVQIDGITGKSIPPYIYEWYFHARGNNAPAAALPNCAEPTCLVSTSAVSDDAGEYFAIVRGTEGMSARSQPGHLTVVAPPRIDLTDGDSVGTVVLTLLVGLVLGGCMGPCLRQALLRACPCATVGYSKVERDEQAD